MKLNRKKRAVNILRKAVEEYNSQSEVAQKIGVSQASVSTWMTGEYLPNAESVLLIENAFMEKANNEKQVDITEEMGMIRNIDVDAIRKRCEEIGIARKQLCDRIGKSDNYFHNLSENGCTGEMLEEISKALWSNPEDFIKGKKPLYDCDLEVSDVAIKTELHKLRSKIGSICTDLSRLEQTTKKSIDEINYLLAEVIGELYKELGMTIDKRGKSDE